MPRLSELPAASTLDADDEFYVVQDGNSRNCNIPQIMAVSALGWGQAWENVSGTREIVTVYQNTTGRPITVSIFAGSSSTIGTFEVSVDGSTDWVSVFQVTNASTTDIRQGVGIVPPGHYYRLTTGDFGLWVELR